MRRMLAVLLLWALSAQPVAALRDLRDDCDGPDMVLGRAGHPDSSQYWDTTSGILYRRNELCAPWERSFRAHTWRQFTNSRIDGRFRLNRWNTEDPASAPDAAPQFGVLVMARWLSYDEMYYIALERRPDTKLHILKKIPKSRAPAEGPTSSRTPPGVAPDDFGVQTGVYYTLAELDGASERLQRWVTFRVAVANTADARAVRIRLYLDQKLIGEVWDDGSVGGPPLTTGGQIGFRSDNGYWRWDDLVISEMPAAYRP
jgi:hypothetical protein